MLRKQSQFSNQKPAGFSHGSYSDHHNSLNEFLHLLESRKLIYNNISLKLITQN